MATFGTVAMPTLCGRGRALAMARYPRSRPGVSSVQVPPPATAAVRARLDDVIAEMRRVGIWDTAAPRPHDGPIGAFGQGAGMAFEQWLRHVFVPRVEETLAAGGPWPPASAVAAQATREWKMWSVWPEADGLIAALERFDALFGSPAPN
jgi:uncharacterized protein YqcC (DUF446 family)